MKITANAKINLTLDITGIRPDGFHSLRSVMVPISLCDELTFEENEKFAFSCDIKALETNDNLCVRAAKLFFEKTKKPDGVSIHLQKNIPFPAGLGGGSADAAAVLKGLNSFYGMPICENALFELAEKLGSDVSLCLLGRGALCEGRGEVLTPIKSIGVMPVVIAIGEGRLSTPDVYRRYDAMNLPVRNDTDFFLSALAANDRERLLSSLGNAFEPVADELCPETKTLRKRLSELGAANARLSGSGPSVFGIFNDEQTARLAVDVLESEGFSAYFCKTVK